MSEILNNLPERPYKKFFGREESIKLIDEILLEGNTFIASIDGVGGIGKTALAYFFCESILLNNESNQYGYFDYIVWVTAKETVFDALSENRMIKNVNNNFEGINGLMNTTFSVIGLEEIIDSSIEEKILFFEEEILKKEPILFILDNLETVNDIDFFNYITRKFNSFAAQNRRLKILTTSRKRKQIADFPVEIEGLSTEDALAMLKYLAVEYDISDILKTSDHNNLKLIERVGNIPLGIEFIIGQMRRKRTRGEIYAELDGYPPITDDLDSSEKKKRISDIILFSFKNMFESLDNKQKDIFKVIAALEKNRHKHDPNVSFELLMSITNYKKSELEESLEILLDNKLIIYNNINYTISPMAINFVRQFYDDFEHIEDEVIGKKNVIFNDHAKPKDNIDILISNIKPMLNNNEYEECEETLLKALDVSSDYRIYYELAKVQRILNKFSKASDSFRTATKLNQKNVKIWYDWIDMEDNRGRKNIASQIIEDALISTNYDISIVLLKININKYKKDYDTLRANVERYLKIYNDENRKNDSLKLLRHWKGIEYTILDSKYKDEYFTAVDSLTSIETDKDIILQLMREALKVAKRKKINSKEKEYARKIKILEQKILQSMDVRVKKLNQLFNGKKYDEAKKEARKILNWISLDDHEKENAKNALRVLLQITATEKDYDRIIIIFEDYKEIGYLDDNCHSIYKKAKKEKLNIEHEELIEKISVNLQNIEIELRNILTTVIGDDDKLCNIVISKGKDEWIDQWKDTKKKSLKSDLSIIHYSDLSHIRSLLSWNKNSIVNMCNNKSRYHAKDYIKKIIAYLENYITKERNETFHSRLQFATKDELNEILVDTNRLLKSISSLQLLMINENA